MIMRALTDFGFKINDAVLLFVSISILLLIILLIVIASGKKNGTVSSGKKGLVVFLTILTSFAVIATPLVYMNIIPLSLHLGYYIEVNDIDGNNKISGYKITMEGVSYYEEMDINRLDQKKSSEGEYVIASSFVTFYFSNKEDVVYEITTFSRHLCVNGDVAYTFIKDIEMR